MRNWWGHTKVVSPTTTPAVDSLVLSQDLAGDNGDGGGTANNGVLEGDEGIEISLPTNNSAANAGARTERRLIRSDQIGFIRNRGSDQPVAPELQTEFTSRRIADDRIVQYSRVWYGHLARSLDSGERPSEPRLGETDSGNLNPLDWLLGRQAVFLDGTLVQDDGSGNLARLIHPTVSTPKVLP